MDKKELIFEAALQLFVENGFHGTATSKIAQTAGVANGTLFQYFKTKDELVISLYVKLKNELAAYISVNSEAATDTKSMMKSNFLASLFWGLDNPVKFHFIQQFNSSPYTKRIEQAILDQQTEPHLSLIQKGIAEGILKPLPIELIYALISSQVSGLYQYLVSKQFSKVEQHGTIQMTFDLIWDMLT